MRKKSEHCINRKFHKYCSLKSVTYNRSHPPWSIIFGERWTAIFQIDSDTAPEIQQMFTVALFIIVQVGDIDVF